jgi:hypothetical protein
VALTISVNHANEFVEHCVLVNHQDRLDRIGFHLDELFFTKNVFKESYYSEHGVYFLFVPGGGVEPPDVCKPQINKRPTPVVVNG